MLVDGLPAGWDQAMDFTARWKFLWTEDGAWELMHFVQVVLDPSSSQNASFVSMSGWGWWSLCWLSDPVLSHAHK